MKFIVSLTSYGHRLEMTTPYAICSLLNQTVLPDAIILWLAYGTNVPTMLDRLTDIGLEIRFCEDMRSYTKLIPTLETFPEDVIITADDDVFYPQNWLEQLKLSYKKDPSKIHVHRAHEILTDNMHQVLPYKEWTKCVGTEVSEITIFPTGVGGILYPPGTLSSICTNKKLFTALAPTADDIWFWAMARLINTKYLLIQDGYKVVRNVDVNDHGMWIANVYQGKNDNQLMAVMDYFPVLKELTKKIDSVKINQAATIEDVSLTMHKIVVLVPFRNAKNHIIDCLNSILSQEYDNYIVYLLDNASDDGTTSLVEESEKIHICRSSSQLATLETLHNALTTLAIKDEDIVLILPGEDCLLGEFVFQLINEKYNAGKLLTYGQFIDNCGNVSNVVPYSKVEFDNIRKAPWKAAHLITFKYRLFKELTLLDPDSRQLKFSGDDRFYDSAYDLALMLPLMEIAGYEKIGAIHNVLYCHRSFPKKSLTQMERLQQMKTEQDIRGKTLDISLVRGLILRM